MTKQKIKNHFLYHSWMYVLVVIISIVSWDLIYTATAYRPPEDKKLELYIADNPLADQEDWQNFLHSLQSEGFVDMEQMDAVKLISGGDQDYYLDIQLNTFVMAQQGDVYFIGRDRFKSFGSMGAFLPLDGYVESGALSLAGLNLERGILSYENEQQETVKALFGVPLNHFPALQRYGIDTNNSYLAILYNNGNDDNAVRLLNAILQRE